MKYEKVDPADVVMLTHYFSDDYYREQESFINHIDTIISMAESFYFLHKDTDWENAEDDWESTLYKFFRQSMTNLNLFI